MAHCAVETAYATCVALSCICTLVWGTWIGLHNDRRWVFVFEPFSTFLKVIYIRCLAAPVFFTPFIARINISSADLNLLLSNNHFPSPHTKDSLFSASRMHSSILISLLSLLALSRTVPIPQSDDNPVDVVSNSVSPLSANTAGNSNSDTGLLDGSSISLSPRTDYNPVDVVSNSVSPLSANSAGNSNSNTGILDGADIDVKRDAQSDPADVVSNSLSPLSDNVAGNNNQNTGTLDGDTVNVDPEIDPTVNV